MYVTGWTGIGKSSTAYHFFIEVYSNCQNDEVALTTVAPSSTDDHFEDYVLDSSSKVHQLKIKKTMDGKTYSANILGRFTNLLSSTCPIRKTAISYV